jgi:hypothetical protein
MGEKSSFWSTIPGILTGIAAVITAMGGLLAILYQTGVIGPEKNADNGSLPVLASPIIREPECNSVIPTSSVTHGLAFTWWRVEGASTYTVEVDCFGCSGYGRNWYSLAAGRPWHIRPGLGLRSPRYTSTTVVDQMREAGGHALRWRVWGVDQEGKEGAKSEWCQFAFAGSW